jgi:trehalose synthase
MARVIRDAAPVPLGARVSAQVSRWDRLKDPLGVMLGFARTADQDSYLLLVGPDPGSVADDPEGAGVYREVTEAWRALPGKVRSRVHLVRLPVADVEENAAMVNAIQRYSNVVVQKSLYEGFGLTVTEALWKARPVIASAVGGIRDQIEDGVDGLLLQDPRDLETFAALLERLLGDEALGARLGRTGHARTFERYLGIGSLLRYGELIERLDERTGGAAA